MNRTVTSIIFAVLLALMFVNANVRTKEAPYLLTKTPIVDEQGRVSVIVDFNDDAEDAYPEEIDAKVRAITVVCLATA
jgi:hypothetical protein